MPDRTRPPRIVYIAGYGRSGSTLLDMILGQHPAVVSAGEVTTLSRHVWAQREYCSCGKTAPECERWGEIGSTWLARPDDAASLPAYHRLQADVEAIVSPVRLLRRTLFRRAFDRYAARTLLLFDAIRSQSGKDIVIDSSKLPGRALALHATGAVDLRVIHLVRDGRGVAASMLRPYEVDAKAGLQKKLVSKPAFRTAIRWCLVNLAAEMLRRRVGPQRYLQIRYEDFIADPRAGLAAIGELTGLDFAPIADALMRGDAIHPVHQIAGSRLRMTKSIRLERSDDWRTRLSPRQRAHFDLLGGWLLRRYGYPKG